MTYSWIPFGRSRHDLRIAWGRPARRRTLVCLPLPARLPRPSPATPCPRFSRNLAPSDRSGGRPMVNQHYAKCPPRTSHRRSGAGVRPGSGRIGRRQLAPRLGAWAPPLQCAVCRKRKKEAPRTLRSAVLDGQRVSLRLLDHRVAFLRPTLRSRPTGLGPRRAATDGRWVTLAVRLLGSPRTTAVRRR